MARLSVGASGFADDIILHAPGRTAMAKMLSVCEDYARNKNLLFSTHPNPGKSKSKCVFMTGPRLRNIPKPAPLQLNGVDLPWVASATHMGHELCQDLFNGL
jgi:hypothetical protein